MILESVLTLINVASMLTDNYDNYDQLGWTITHQALL